MKLKRILERHDEVGTVGYMVYAGTDNKFYADPELTVQLTVDDLSNAFVKGCVINKSGVLHKPTSLNADGSLSYGESSGGSSQKLYAHHINIGSDGWLTEFQGDIFLTVISTVAEPFCNYEIDGDPDSGEIYNPFTFADLECFKPHVKYQASGGFGVAPGDPFIPVCYFIRAVNSFTVGAVHPEYNTIDFYELLDYNIEWAHDTVTEVM